LETGAYCQGRNVQTLAGGRQWGWTEYRHISSF
jgi:hypothetical protein